MTPCSFFERNFGQVAGAGAVWATGFIELPQLALAFSDNAEEFPRQVDGLLLGVSLEDCEAAHEFFGLGEWTVGYADLPAGSPYPHTQRAGEAAFGRKEPACFHAFFDQLAHGCHFLLGGRGGPFCGLVDTQESHCRLLLLRNCLGPGLEFFRSRLSINTSNQPWPIRQGMRKVSYFLAATCSRCFRSCSRSSGVKLSPKSAASKTGRISTSLSSQCGLGQRFSHSTASSMERTCQIQ